MCSTTIHGLGQHMAAHDMCGVSVQGMRCLVGDDTTDGLSVVGFRVRVVTTLAHHERGCQELSNEPTHALIR